MMALVEQALERFSDVFDPQMYPRVSQFYFFQGWREKQGKYRGCRRACDLLPCLWQQA